eukprot:Clim_evm43s236 gene=Clim_evmTU43s236
MDTALIILLVFMGIALIGGVAMAYRNYKVDPRKLTVDMKKLGNAVRIAEAATGQQFTQEGLEVTTQALVEPIAEADIFDDDMEQNVAYQSAPNFDKTVTFGARQEHFLSTGHAKTTDYLGAAESVLVPVASANSFNAERVNSVGIFRGNPSNLLVDGEGLPDLLILQSPMSFPEFCMDPVLANQDSRPRTAHVGGLVSATTAAPTSNMRDGPAFHKRRILEIETNIEQDLLLAAAYVITEVDMTVIFANTKPRTEVRHERVRFLRSYVNHLVSVVCFDGIFIRGIDALAEAGMTTGDIADLIVLVRNALPEAVIIIEGAIGIFPLIRDAINGVVGHGAVMTEKGELLIRSGMRKERFDTAVAGLSSEQSIRNDFQTFIIDFSGANLPIQLTMSFSRWLKHNNFVGYVAPDGTFLQPVDSSKSRLGSEFVGAVECSKEPVVMDLLYVAEHMDIPTRDEITESWDQAMQTLRNDREITEPLLKHRLDEYNQMLLFCEDAPKGRYVKRDPREVDGRKDARIPPKIYQEYKNGRHDMAPTMPLAERLGPNYESAIARETNTSRKKVVDFLMPLSMDGVSDEDGTRLRMSLTDLCKRKIVRFPLQQERSEHEREVKESGVDREPTHLTTSCKAILEYYKFVMSTISDVNSKYSRILTEQSIVELKYGLEEAMEMVLNDNIEIVMMHKSTMMNMKLEVRSGGTVTPILDGVGLYIEGDSRYHIFLPVSDSIKIVHVAELLLLHQGIHPALALLAASMELSQTDQDTMCVPKRWIDEVNGLTPKGCIDISVLSSRKGHFYKWGLNDNDHKALRAWVYSCYDHIGHFAQMSVLQETGAYNFAERNVSRIMKGNVFSVENTALYIWHKALTEDARRKTFFVFLGRLREDTSAAARLLELTFRNAFWNLCLEELTFDVFRKVEVPMAEPDQIAVALETTRGAPIAMTLFGVPMNRFARLLYHSLRLEAAVQVSTAMEEVSDVRRLENRKAKVIKVFGLSVSGLYFSLPGAVDIILNSFVGHGIFSSGSFTGSLSACVNVALIVTFTLMGGLVNSGAVNIAYYKYQHSPSIVAHEVSRGLVFGVHTITVAMILTAGICIAVVDDIDYSADLPFAIIWSCLFGIYLFLFATLFLIRWEGTLFLSQGPLVGTLGSAPLLVAFFLATFASEEITGIPSDEVANTKTSDPRNWLLALIYVIALASTCLIYTFLYPRLLSNWYALPNRIHMTKETDIYNLYEQLGGKTYKNDKEKKRWERAARLTFTVLCLDETTRKWYQELPYVGKYFGYQRAPQLQQLGDTYSVVRNRASQYRDEALIRALAHMGGDVMPFGDIWNAQVGQGLTRIKNKKSAEQQPRGDLLAPEAYRATAYGILYFMIIFVDRWLSIFRGNPPAFFSAQGTDLNEGFIHGSTWAVLYLLIVASTFEVILATVTDLNPIDSNNFITNDPLLLENHEIHGQKGTDQLRLFFLKRKMIQYKEGLYRLIFFMCIGFVVAGAGMLLSLDSDADTKNAVMFYLILVVGYTALLVGLYHKVFVAGMDSPVLLVMVFAIIAGLIMGFLIIGIDENFGYTVSVLMASWIFAAGMMYLSLRTIMDIDDITLDRRLQTSGMHLISHDGNHARSLRRLALLQSDNMWKLLKSSTHIDPNEDELGVKIAQVFYKSKEVPFYDHEAVEGIHRNHIAVWERLTTEAFPDWRQIVAECLEQWNGKSIHVYTTRDILKGTHGAASAQITEVDGGGVSLHVIINTSVVCTPQAMAEAVLHEYVEEVLKYTHHDAVALEACLSLPIPEEFSAERGPVPTRMLNEIADLSQAVFDKLALGTASAIMRNALSLQHEGADLSSHWSRMTHTEHRIVAKALRTIVAQAPLPMMKYTATDEFELMNRLLLPITGYRDEREIRQQVIRASIRIHLAINLASLISNRPLRRTVIPVGFSQILGHARADVDACRLLLKPDEFEDLDFFEGVDSPGRHVTVDFPGHSNGMGEKQQPDTGSVNPVSDSTEGFTSEMPLEIQPTTPEKSQEDSLFHLDESTLMEDIPEKELINVWSYSFIQSWWIITYLAACGDERFGPALHAHRTGFQRPSILFDISIAWSVFLLWLHRYSRMLRYEITQSLTGRRVPGIRALQRFLHHGALKRAYWDSVSGVLHGLETFTGADSVEIVIVDDISLDNADARSRDVLKANPKSDIHREFFPWSMGSSALKNLTTFRVEERVSDVVDKTQARKKCPSPELQKGQKLRGRMTYMADAGWAKPLIRRDLNGNCTTFFGYKVPKEHDENMYLSRVETYPGSNLIHPGRAEPTSCFEYTDDGHIKLIELKTAMPANGVVKSETDELITDALLTGHVSYSNERDHVEAVNEWRIQSVLWTVKRRVKNEGRRARGSSRSDEKKAEKTAEYEHIDASVEGKALHFRELGRMEIKYHSFRDYPNQPIHTVAWRGYLTGEELVLIKFQAHDVPQWRCFSRRYVSPQKKSPRETLNRDFQYLDLHLNHSFVTDCDEIKPPKALLDFVKIADNTFWQHRMGSLDLLAGLPLHVKPSQWTQWKFNIRHRRFGVLDWAELPKKSKDEKKKENESRSKSSANIYTSNVSLMSRMWKGAGSLMSLNKNSNPNLAAMEEKEDPVDLCYVFPFRDLSLREKRNHLWRAWRRGDIDGVFARHVDINLLRRSEVGKLLKLRDEGRMEYVRRICRVRRTQMLAVLEMDQGPKARTHLRVDMKYLAASGYYGIDRDFIKQFKTDGTVDAINVDSGTWPMAGGGVSNCRRDLVDNIESVAWFGVAEVANDACNTTPGLQILKHVTDVTIAPLWSVHDDAMPNSLWSNETHLQIGLRQLHISEESMKSEFLPLLGGLLAGCFDDLSTDGNPSLAERLESYSQTFVGLFIWFQKHDWKATWSHRLVHRAYAEQWTAHMQKAIRSGELMPSEMPSFADLGQTLMLYSHLLTPFAIPLVAPGKELHASHHGLQTACYAVPHRRLTGSRLVIWDHGILWRERLHGFIYARSSRFIRQAHLGLERLGNMISYYNADILCPCTNFLNPDWETWMAGLRGGSLELEMNARRKIAAVTNGMNVSRFKPAPELEYPTPCAVMLSHVNAVKDVINAITAASYIVWTYGLSGFKLFIYGSLNSDPGYVERCRTAIANFSLQKNVFLMGLGNPQVVLPSGWLFINSSFTEGLPLAVGEAGLAGLPVVCTDVGGTKEVLTDLQNRIIGRVVPPADSHTLAEGIMSVLAMTKDLDVLGGDVTLRELIAQGPETLWAEMCKEETKKRRRDLGLVLREFVQGKFGFDRYTNEHEQLIRSATDQPHSERIPTWNDSKYASWSLEATRGIPLAPTVDENENEMTGGEHDNDAIVESFHHRDGSPLNDLGRPVNDPQRPTTATGGQPDDLGMSRRYGATVMAADLRQPGARMVEAYFASTSGNPTNGPAHRPPDGI